MAIKPILFNTDMVRAILDGRKTQTRRLIKPHLAQHEAGWRVCISKASGVAYGIEAYDEDERSQGMIPPPYCPGDILWVRETWTALPVSPGGHTRIPDVYYYKAGPELRPENWRGNWHPSIHMPKEAARLFLRVKDVRVERLQDCGNAQAKDEGCTCCAQFIRIWNGTIKPTDLHRYGWDANPWVWTIEFERIKGKPAGLWADRDTAQYADQDVLMPAT